MYHIGLKTLSKIPEAIIQPFQYLSKVLSIATITIVPQKTRQMLQHRGGEPSMNYSEFEIHACLFFRNLSKVIKGLTG